MINRKRMHSRSNQALKQLISTIDSQRNPSQDMNIRRVLDTQLEQKQLFKQSFAKIQKIKALFTRQSNHQLMYDQIKYFRQQLNDIVDLLRGERVKAKMTIQDLHKMATQAQQKQKIYKNRYKQIGVNTDGIIICEMIDKIDQNIQTDQYEEQIQQHQTKIQVNENKQIKKYQSYYKLVCMIDKLKVDYRQILPEMPDLPQSYILPDVENKISEYKILKPQQVFKLQKVFITKLANMLKQSKKQKVTEMKKQPQTQKNQTYKTPQKIQQIEPIKNEPTTESSLRKSSSKSSTLSIKKSILLNYRKKSQQSSSRF